MASSEHINAPRISIIHRESASPRGATKTAISLDLIEHHQAQQRRIKRRINTADMPGHAATSNAGHVSTGTRSRAFTPGRCAGRGYRIRALANKVTR
jgi:hypothetical protein